MAATDSDLGDNGIVTYSILSGNTGNKLGINSATGVIYLKDTLDRESLDTYSLVVHAADKALTPMTSTADVTVTVTDVNDNAPSCPSSWVYTVNEGSSAGTVGTISCTDSDIAPNDQLQYSITLGANGQFSLDASTGVLSTLSSLDYETVKYYQITIEVADQGAPSLTTTGHITVKVGAVNEHTPIISSPSVVSVTESVAVPSSALYTMTATDGDDSSTSDGIIRWTISGGNTNDEFAVDESTGAINVVAPLNRETVETYNLVIQATDSSAAHGNELSSSATVTVSVTDANDNAPVFNPSGYAVIVSEDASVSSTVIQVTASDADTGNNAVLTYSISQGNSESKFAISGDNIILSAQLDAETTTQYLLQIVASDGGSPSLSSTANVVISVSYVNEFDPVIGGSSSVSVNEDISVGIVIFTASASDSDASDDGVLR